MRLSRLILILAGLAVLVTATACASQSATPAPAEPQATLHPTFTPTPLQPTPTPVPPTPTPEPPTPTPEPPTPEPTVEQPTATPEPALVEVSAANVNLRSGPGTGFTLAGRASQGQRLPILGRTEASDWYQVQMPDGATAWVVNDVALVRIVGETAGVAIAENIPSLPTPRPQPTRAPQPVVRPTAAPAQPTQPPAPAYRFVKHNFEPRPNTNPIVSFFGGLFNRTLDWGSPISGYKMVAIAPNGQRFERDFGTVFEFADSGLPSQFRYNAKLEAPPMDGTWKVFVADAGGNQVAEAWDANVSGDTRTFIPRWKEP